MRVAVNAYFLQHPHTGSGQYIRHLLPALAALESPLTLLPLVPAPPPTLWDQYGGPRVQTVPPALTSVLRSGDLRKVWWEQVTWARAAHQLRPNVAHVPYFAPPLWAPRGLVVTIHDLIPLIVPAYITRPQVRVYNALVAVAARRAALVIADSRATATDVRRLLGIPAERIRVVPLAADPAARPVVDGAMRRAVLQRYDLQLPFLFYIGGLDQRKNVAALLRAFAALPDSLRTTHQLAIAGARPQHNPRLFPDVTALATQLGIDRHVRWLGHISDAEKFALYSAATLFAFPSLYEGFGLDPLEAMACGAPVLCSNRSSLPEVVQEGAALVDPADHTCFTQEMAALLESPARRRALRAAGRAVAARFSWPATAHATLAAYEIAAQSPGRR